MRERGDGPLAVNDGVVGVGVEHAKIVDGVDVELLCARPRAHRVRERFESVHHKLRLNSQN